MVLQALVASGQLLDLSCERGIPRCHLTRVREILKGEGDVRAGLDENVLHGHHNAVDDLVAQTPLALTSGIDLEQHGRRRDDDQRDENEELSLIPKRSDRHHLPIRDCGTGNSAANSLRSRRIWAAPSATQSIGRSATRTGMPVMSASVGARPAIEAP